MTKINDGGPVHPAHVRAMTPNGLVSYDTEPSLSLRDAAALAALQGFCSQCDSTGLRAWLPDMAAEEAWRTADAFIAAQETKET